MDFARFDVRHYPTLSVTDGYREWAPTYERVVQDEMDLRLLERMTTVDWARGRADARPRLRHRAHRPLAARARASRSLDGIDLTPEMLAQARAKEVVRSPAAGRPARDRPAVRGL